MDKNLYIKIPKKIIEFIDENRDKNYKSNINYNISINEQELQQDTRTFLALIYRDYLCTPEEKKRLIEEDEIALKREEDELREKYSVDVFEKRKTRQKKN
jgi:hypothetical protein